MHPRYRRERPLNLATALAAGTFWLGLLGVSLWLSDKYVPEYGMAFGLSAFVLFLILTYAADALRRAHNRAWIEFSSTILTAQIQMLLSQDHASFDAATVRFHELLDRLEAEVGEGPYFNGAKLALVDCAFAPFFLRTTIMEPYLELGVFTQRPRIQAWSKALIARDTVQRAVVPHYAEVLIDSWRARAPLGRELFAGRRS